MVSRAERGRFAPGHRGGPGRPRKGESLSESWRRDTDWEKIRARLEAIALSPKTRDADAIAAARELLDRGWGKPLSSHELMVVRGADVGEERSFAHLSDEQLRERLAWLRGELPEGGEGS